MLFLGIISWKDASCFNGGVVFQMLGASFLSGECAPHGGISFDGGFLKKNVDGGGVPLIHPHYGKPGCL